MQLKIKYPLFVKEKSWKALERKSVNQTTGFVEKFAVNRQQYCEKTPKIERKSAGRTSSRDDSAFLGPVKLLHNWFTIQDKRIGKHWKQISGANSNTEMHKSFD